VWQETLASDIWKKLNDEEKQKAGAHATIDDPGLKDNGYLKMENVIDKHANNKLRDICSRIFLERNGEQIHFLTGAKRLSAFMSRQHFFDLAEQSYTEHVQGKPDPYQFVEHLPIWSSEVLPEETCAILAIMRIMSQRMGAQIPQEFELVSSYVGDDKSPQMWHFDGTSSNFAGVYVIVQHDGSSCRGSTELAEYPHKDYMGPSQNATKLEHVGWVFGNVTRKKIKKDLVRQDQVQEELKDGLNIVNWPVKLGDLCVFYTDHLHRGAASEGQSFACFCAWTRSQTEEGHTDSCPVTCMNWRELYTKKWPGTT